MNLTIIAFIYVVDVVKNFPFFLLLFHHEGLLALCSLSLCL